MLSERVFKRRTTSNSNYLLRLAALQNVRQKQNDDGKYLHPPLRAREHYSLFQHGHATVLYWDIRWRVQVQRFIATDRRGAGGDVWHKQEEQKWYCACAILILLSVSPWRESLWDNLDGFTITSKCACCFMFVVVFCIPILGESDKWIVNHIRDKTKLKTGFMG